MRLAQSIALLFPFAVSLPLACNHGSDGASPGPTTATAATAAAAPPSTSAEPRTQRGEHGADPTNALLQATSELKLTDAQKSTIHALEEQLESNEKDTGVAFKALRADLAAQVRAGAMDKAKVQAAEGAAVSALQVHIAKEADTLNGLHAALDSSQRKAAVAAVRSRATGEPQPGAEPPPAPAAEDAAKRRVDHLTRELGLDATQQQKVAALIGEKPAHEQPRNTDRQERMSRLLTAFEGDTFDAKTAAPGAAPGEMIRKGTDREVAFLSKLLPILRPDQREKLASSIETRGMGRGHDDDD